MISKDNFFRTSDDALLYFEDYGTGRPIVMLHGFMCSSRFFQANIEGLSKNNRLILVDFRGHGRSSKVLYPHSIRRYAYDVKELLDFLGVEDALLTGWSMGASVALQYNLLFGKDHISALAIVDPTLAPYDPGEWNTHGLKGYNVDGACNLMINSYNGFDAYCQGFAEKLLCYQGCEEDIKWIKAALLQTPAWIAFSIYTEFAYTNGREMLLDITLPIIIFGANSPVCPNGEDCANIYYGENVPNGIYKEIYTHKIGGHLLFMLDKEAFEQELTGFLQKV
ncbi:MAG: alpha/beta hydrolase [Ruthenibacterium sp.]